MVIYQDNQRQTERKGKGRVGTQSNFHPESSLHKILNVGPDAMNLKICVLLWCIWVLFSSET